MTLQRLPPDIRVIQEGLDTTRYVLPRRKLGKVRWLGVAPLIFGLGVSGFMYSWMAGPLTGIGREHGFAKGISIAFALMGLPGLAIGLGLMLVGIVVMLDISHSEIVVSGNHLRAVERWGLLRWTRKRQIRAIQPIGINGKTLTSSSALSGGYAALSAWTLNKDDNMLVTAGYPAALLVPLAQVLSGTVAGSRSGTLSDLAEDEASDREEAESPVATSDSRAAAAAGDVPLPDDRIAAPPDTNITLQERPGGIAISVPRAGLWRGSKGLFMFSLMWNGFIAVFITLMARTGTPFGIYLFMLIFVAIGLAMLGAALNMGWKRILLAVANDTLAYETISPFGVVRKQFHRKEIESIGVGPSGMSVGNVPVMELQILLAGAGGKIGLMSQCSADESAWVAAQLRLRLKVGRT